MSEKLILEFIGKDNVTKTTKGITSALGGLGTVAAGAAVAGLAAAAGGALMLGKGLADSIGEAMAAQEVQAQLAAVLESTGGVAGVTADMANKLATELQGVTRFEDDAILSGENMLLTFTNIGQDVFPTATQTMADMSQALGQDLTQSAMMLGKALNDPAQGIGALRRVGVQFTEDQEDVIKSLVETGDMAGAQTLILQELQREFGGAAEAAGNTFGGQLDRLKNTFGDVKETIGAAFLPVLQELAGMLLSGLNSPEFQAILGALSSFITGVVVPAITTLVHWIRDEVVPRFREFFTELQERVGPVLERLRESIDRISERFGVASGEVDLLDVIFKALDITLDIAIPVIEGVAMTIENLARAVEWVIGVVDDAVDAWNDFKQAVQDAANAIPDVLMPGSPTPFEVGLRGIVTATQDASAALGGGFGAPALAAGGGAGSGVVNVYVTYSPLVSLADRYDAEQRLAPLIREALRAAG